MENMLPFEHIAHFAYWLTESNNLRGADNYSGLARIDYIKRVCISEYLVKYPHGTLTGFKQA